MSSKEGDNIKKQVDHIGSYEYLYMNEVIPQIIIKLVTEKKKTGSCEIWFNNQL